MVLSIYLSGVNIVFIKFVSVSSAYVLKQALNVHMCVTEVEINIYLLLKMGLNLTHEYFQLLKVKIKS